MTRLDLSFDEELSRSFEPCHISDIVHESQIQRYAKISPVVFVTDAYVASLVTGFVGRLLLSQTLASDFPLTL